MKSTLSKSFVKGSKSAVADASPAVVDATAASDLTTFFESSEPNFATEFIATLKVFLETTFTYDRFMQLLILYFVCHTYYLKYETTRFPYTLITTLDASNVLFVIVVNYIGILLSIAATVRKFGTDGFPSFNAMVYGMFVPNLVALMFLYLPESPYLFFSTLSLNYLALDDRLAIQSSFMIKIGSAVLFIQQIVGLQVIPVYLMVVAKYLTLKYFLDYLSTEIVVDSEKKEVSSGRTSLTQTEKHVLVQLLVLVLERSSTSLEFFVLQACVFSLLFSLTAVQPFYQFLYKPSLNSAKSFYALLIAAVFPVAFYIAVETQTAPLIGKPGVWLYHYVTESPFNLQCCTLWAVMLATTALANFSLSALLNTKRKVWHFVLLSIVLLPDALLFLQNAALDETAVAAKNQFVKIALSLVAVGLILAETLRVTQFSPLGKLLFAQFKPFQDDRDNAGPLVISYLFLIFGATLPFYIHDSRYGATQNPLLAYAGIVSVGLGDAMASCCGKVLGGMQWAGPHNKKTLSGSVVGFMASTIVCFLALKYIKTHNWEQLVDALAQGVDGHQLWASVADEQILWACVLTGVMEGISDVNDNLFIPLVMVAVFEAV
ncbi:hypothetical protein BABINDRAFT_163002 [Babjeviella inositovora NRRL Y-12698]|uniref:dolichol kinase n=1 Tax=Babjeviella inositovora NRRL Y-12698 TaxID=984486 RepID=A0A1E3QLJ7_9ASCO|nr:uncharacterized protein BABINDRAFT_163002 [Babjeviella inositovora NRRL Y-12698]ODQ77952.1 hypothetical protein BABINDRAFT_163002 [Babjeviella inositovora NRRL Y-12698]